MASTTSRQEAERIVREIRASRSVDEPPDENSEDLARALRLISEELYSTPTHFLLELVQNADDNKYAPDVTPKLVFLYRSDGYLWMGNNELGFTPANARSICRFHLSTKGVEGAEKVSIGEKGIGFKSVFKVADTVWIRSGNFSFRFDRDARLGMVAPVWDEKTFPTNPSIQEATVLCMRIPEKADRRLVEQHLNGLEPELPLFLRNLRQIRVIFQERKENKDTTRIDYSLIRVVPNEDGVDVKLIKKDHRKGTEDTLLRLIQAEHVTQSMPYEKRRGGVMNSSLKINFPLTVNDEPEIRNRPLYNFLPVRAYGLAFILNGDFLLSANREDVEHGKEWNRALITVTIELFVKAVSRFNSEGILRYTWPQFTQRMAANDGTVFQNLLPDLIKHLQGLPVLESQAGMLKAPQSLIYVPEEFTNGANVPLLDSETALQGYLAAPYFFFDVSSLGVTEQSSGSFLDGIRSLAFANTLAFRSRPYAWHARVARAINYRLSFSDQKLRQTPLIPLRSGIWISANQGQFYFPSSSNGDLLVPKGIEVQVILPEAAANPYRKELYRGLGAKNLDVDHVCQIIVKTHAQHSATYGEWTRSIVIEHAWYLFLARDCLIDNLRSLLLAVEDKRLLQKASSLYMDDDSNFSITKFVPKGMVSYIDPAYYAKAPDHLRNEWLSWLQNQLGVTIIPKLADVSSNMMSQEFSYILRNVPSQSFLRLIVECWDSYSHWFINCLDESVLKSVSSSMANCKVGKVSIKSSLNQTFLPLPSMLDAPFAKDVLPFLTLDGTIDDRWSRLSSLGVGNAMDLKYFLAILTRLPEHGSLHPTKDDVAKIYECIQGKYYEGPELVKTAFQKNLIFIASPSPARWVRLSDCFWHSPTEIQAKPSLSRRYPSFELLFMWYLGLKNASITDIVDQLIAYSGKSSEVQNIKSLLEALSTRLSRGSDHGSINRLKTAAVFPVRESENEVRLGTVEVKNWAIADRDRLQECFNGKIGLLDFPVKEAKEGGKIRKLLEQLQLLDRFLSEMVVESTLVGGSMEFEEELTHVLRGKAKFIARLASKDKRQAVKKQLASIEVFVAESLTLRRSVSIGSIPVVSDEVGLVSMSTVSNGTASMYLKIEDIESNDLPVYHIQEQLRVYFDLPHARSQPLQTIISVNNERQILDMLDRENVEDDADLEEQVEEEGMDYAEPEEQEVNQSGTQAKSLAKPGQMTLPTGKGSFSFTKARRTQRPSQITSGTKFKAFDMDVTQIVAAAKIFTSDRVVGFSGHRQYVPPHHTGKSFQRGGSGLEDMSAVAQALPAPQGSGVSVYHPSRIDAVPQQPDIGAYEKDVGAAGEYFLYNIFKSLFEIDDDAWTSSTRTIYGLPELTIFEGDYADFTIADPDAVTKLTEWFIKGGYTEADEWKQKGITYHVEVKTTVGDFNKAFAMSNNQVEMIKRFHESPTDICVLVRIFNFISTPRVHCFVDPYALQAAGSLKFQAQGFWVQPT